jgi:hypothetical protein
MSTALPTDKVLVNRAGTSYSTTSDMSTVQDTDLLLINRAGVDYKCTFLDWKNSQSKAPDVGTVTLADVAGGSRFTSVAFPVSATMTEDGIPASTKGLKAYVEGTLKTAAQTSGIVSAAVKTVLITTFEVVRYDTAYSWPPTAGADFDKDFRQTTAALTGWTTVSSWTKTDGNAYAVKFPGTTDWTIDKGSATPNFYASNDGLTWDYIGTFASSSSPPAATTYRVTKTATTISGHSKYLMVMTAGTGSFLQTSASSLQVTVLTLTDNTQLANFAAGDAVTEAGNADDGVGTVSAVDAAAVPPTMTLSSVAGTWDVGSAVKGPLKAQMVTVTPNSDVITAVSMTTPPTTYDYWAGNDKTQGWAAGTPLTAAVGSAGSGTIGSVLHYHFPAPGARWGLTSSNSGNGAYGTILVEGSDDGVTYIQLQTIPPPDNNARNIFLSKPYIRISRGSDFSTTHWGIWSALALTQLTFATAKDLAKFAAGDAVRQDNSIVGAYTHYDTRSGNDWATATPIATNLPLGTPPTSSISVASLLFKLTGTTTQTDAISIGMTATGINDPRSVSIYSSTDGRTWGAAVMALPINNMNGISGTQLLTAPGPYVMISGINDFSPKDWWAKVPSGAIFGTVGSVDTTAKTMTLATSTGTWGPANAGHYVIGPTKTGPAANVKLYCKLDAAGAVSDLQSADPGFTAWTPAGTGPYTGTVTFPATLPSGAAPDTDLPAGTTITVEVQATNTSGSDSAKSNTITPA